MDRIIKCVLCDKDVVTKVVNKKYCGECKIKLRKERQKQYHIKSYQRRKEKIKASRIKYENKDLEKVREMKRNWRIKNPEKLKLAQKNYRENYPDRIKESQKMWREKNLDWREIKKKQRDGSRDRINFGGNRIKVLERDNYTCQDCGIKNKLEVHHIDGNDRRSDNPNNDMNNLITLCKICHGRLHSNLYHSSKK